MQKDKIFYWITTGIVALAGLVAGIMYFVSSTVGEGFEHLGFPDYFRVELGIAKLLGALALILPMVSNRIKEWAYVGFAIVFISASTAHLVVEGAAAAISPIIQLFVLVISYVYFSKIKKHKGMTL